MPLSQTALIEIKIKRISPQFLNRQAHTNTQKSALLAPIEG